MKVFSKLNFLVIGGLFTVALLTYYLVDSNKSHTPQIYDCFLFFDEQELLQIRLSENYDKIDKFVLVEACETFTGRPKSLVFAQNRKLFDKFLDKIIYVPITNHFETDNPWKREKYQRNQIMRGLKNCHKEDLILISDVDEIIRGDKIDEIKDALLNKKVQLVVCGQNMYFGFLNRFHPVGSPWYGPVALRYNKAKRLLPEKIRKLRNLKPRQLRLAKIENYMALPGAGWHFSSMGGLERYITKLESFSHTELNKPERKNFQSFAQTIKIYPLVQIDESFPTFVRDNQEYLTSIGFIDF